MLNWAHLCQMALRLCRLRKTIQSPWQSLSQVPAVLLEDTSDFGRFTHIISENICAVWFRASVVHTVLSGNDVSKYIHITNCTQWLKVTIHYLLQYV